MKSLKKLNLPFTLLSLSLFLVTAGLYVAIFSLNGTMSSEVVNANITISLVTTIYALGSFFARPIAGILIDSHHRWKAAVFAFLMLFVSHALLAVYEQWYLILFLRIISGFSWAIVANFLFSECSKLMRDHLSSNRYGFFVAIPLIGMISGSIISDIFYESERNLQIASTVSALFIALSLLLAWRYWTPNAKQTNKSGAPRDQRFDSSNLLNVFFRPIIIRTAPIFLVGMASFSALLSVTNRTIGNDESQRIFFPLYAAGVILSRSFLGSLQRVLGFPRLLLISAMLASTGIFCLSTEHLVTTRLLPFIALTTGSGLGLLLSNPQVIVMKYTEDWEKGRANAAVSLVTDFSIFFGGPLISFVADLYSLPMALKLCASILLIVPILTMVFWLPESIHRKAYSIRTLK